MNQFIEPALCDWLKDVDARVQCGIQFGKTKGFINVGDPVILVTGWKQGSGFTNTMRIMYVEGVSSICLEANFKLQDVL